MGEEHYKSREFCRDIGCEVQQELDRHERGSKMYEQAKQECRGNCKETRQTFLMWLRENEYALRNTQENADVFAGGTAYEFHDWLQKHGVEIVKDV
ncbi:MAG: hypothetical protein KKD17_00895 [Nanoarchaeota archaeon]|nr:hypothetical protein [Nanoarchaeota archaeon]